MNLGRAVLDRSLQQSNSSNQLQEITPTAQYEAPPLQTVVATSTYWDRYANFVSQYGIDIGPYATGLLAGLWPKSLVPFTGGRPPLLGSTNPLTSVPRALGVPGADSAIVRTGAAGVGLATVGIGFYELEGFWRAPGDWVSVPVKALVC